MNGAASNVAPFSLLKVRRGMGTCAIYIDGGYLDKVLQQDYQQTRVDIGQLVEQMRASDTLLRAYYYHCMPYQSDPPTADEQRRYASKRRFMDALSFIPRFQVRLGHLHFQGLTDRGQPIFQQKRVDMMLGVDMALLAVKQRVDRMVLLTGDSDTIPAVEAVKPEGVVVTLWHGPLTGRSSPSRDLYQIVDERVEIGRAVVDTIMRLGGGPTAE